MNPAGVEAVKNIKDAAWRKIKLQYKLWVKKEDLLVDPWVFNPIYLDLFVSLKKIEYDSLKIGGK